MLKNRNKWFYAFIVAAVLLVAAAVVIVAISAKPETPQGEVNVPEEGAETGVYYYGVEQGDIILSLNSGNKFTIAGPGLNRSGTYTVTGQDVAFTFVQGNDVATAVLGEDVVTMTLNGSVMTFLKQVNYTVTFDTKGGDTIAPVTVCNGKYVQMPATPAKEGHVFIGWYADEACKTAYQFTDAITADVTVYAGWVEKAVGMAEYTARFELGYDGAEQLAEMTTINGKLYNVPVPTREGFAFGGWFVSMYEDSQKLTYAYNEDTVLTADTTLYAVWHENGGSKLAGPDVSVSATGIKWNAVNGASAYEIKVMDAEGNVIHEESLGATSRNFEFATLDAGDYTVEVIAVSSNTANNSDATVRYFSNKALDRVSNFRVINGMLIFNAVDNAQNYLITIDCGNDEHNHTLLNNGNSTVYNFSNCQMQEGGIRFTVIATANGYANSVPQTFVYDRSLSAVENLVYDAEGDRFVWDLVEDAAGYMVTVTVGDDTFTFQNGTANSFSTAAFSGEITVAVTPVTEGYNAPEAVTATCTKTAPAAPQNVRVDGMVITWDAVEGATKYEVKVGSTTYEVTTNSLDLVEKRFDASVGVSYQILVKTIAGSEGSGYSEPVTAQYRNLDTNMFYRGNTVYWTPVLGCTNFDVRVNGGDIVRVSGTNCAQVVLTKRGVNVIEVRCADLSSGEWVAIEVTAYEVVYHSRSLDGEVREYLAIGDSMLLPQHFTSEGYDFAGWYNTPGAAAGNGMEYTQTVFTGNGDMALYANWSPKDYNIQFIVDSHITNIVNESTQSVTYTKDFMLPPAVTSNQALGYFVGWYTGPSGTGLQVTDSEGYSVAPYDVIGDSVVYPYFADALSYELLSDGTYGVKKGPGIVNKSISEIKIPATYKDVPVTQIVDNAFNKCYDIVTVLIPDTITRIGIGAFEGCSSLEKFEVYVVDPASTTPKIYSSADGALLFFDEASGNTYLELFPRAKTGTYTIPENVDNVRPYAFNYSRLEKVIISKGVKYIAESAFYKCSKLHTIEFEFGREESVTIENNAFNELPKVETLILPAKLNVIEDLKTLDKLEALKTIQVEAGGENYSATENLLCDALGTSLLYVPNSFAGVFEAPMGITAIGAYTFANKDSVTEVIVPGYVNHIGEGAFSGCENLTKVTVRGPRNNDLTIEANAFAGCVRMTGLIFEGGSSASGGGAITIGDSAFAECVELDKLEVGEGVIIASIGSNAFAGDILLNELNIADSAVIGQIGEYAFKGCISIKEYTVHASTTAIGSYAFMDCSYLETVEFAPNGGEVTFGEGVFQNCVRLTTIKLPATLSGFDGSVFDGCEHISTVEVEAGNPYLETKDGALYTKGLTELIYYPRNLDGDLTKLPWDTLTKIGPAVFKGNAKVTSVVIGDKITEIGKGAFDSCINLTSVTFANMDGDMIIGDNAFYGCAQLTAIDVPAKTTSIGANAFYMTKLAAFTIPETVTHIGGLAFAYTNLTEIRIPAAVTYIGHGAFYKVAALSSVTFVGGTEPLVLGAVDMESTWVHLRTEKNPPVFDERGVFADTALTEISLPANISVIGDFTFNNLTALTTVNIPAQSQLKQIGMNAFNKTGISQINLNEGLEFIGEHAFALTKLTTITIPGTVQHLRAYALSVSTLSEIIFAPNTNEGASLIVYNFAMLGTSVTEVTLPAHLTLIGEYDATYVYHTVENVFYTHTKYAVPAGIGTTTTLNKIHVAEGGASYGSKDGILYEKNEAGELADLQFCPKGNTGDIIIPNTVIHVQHSAFLDTQLSSIVFEEFPKDDPRYGTQLLVIGDYTGASYECPKVIGGESSGYRTQLTLISFPSHLSEIGSRSLYNLNKDSKAEAKLVLQFNPDALVNIKTCAITNNNAVKAIYLPKVASIGRLGLNNNSMSELTFAPGSTLTEIGERAFEGDSKLTSIKLPASVTTLVTSAFYSCSGLTSFTQEEGGLLETIGDKAFYGCSGFVNFKIPNTVVVVGSNAFANCQKLQTLEISANMQTAVGGEGSIVAGCSALKEIIVPEDHAYLKSVDGVLYDKQMTILYIYPQAKGEMTTAIPETVHTIEAGAFQNYKGTSITLPKSLRYIRNSAFANASKLKSILIPASVLSIDLKAFYSTGSLATVTFEEGSKLETIGVSAFDGCGMTSMIVPDGVTTVGQRAFAACHKLTSIVLPAALKTLGNYAISSCSKLESVTMQEGLEVIGDRAFQSTASLREITIPDTVTKLGSYMFYASTANNTSLERVLMSENSMLTEIGDCAFYKCVKLKQVTFGDLVEKVGKTIFFDCTALEQVRLSNAMPEIPADLFKNCAKLTSVTIPASATKIGENAFLNCTGLTEITIPAGVTEIGANAFSGCNGIANVSIEAGCMLKKIGDGAFENCTALTAFDIPGTVTEIGNAAFKNSALTAVKLPATLSKIGDYAFYGCLGLTSVGVPSSVTMIGAYAFAGCVNMESLALSVGLKNIGDFAFADCAKIKEVTIPETVAFMGANPFANCAGLTELGLDAGNEDFVYRDGVLFDKTMYTLIAYPAYRTDTYYEIPASVYELAGGAFAGSQLQSIKIPESIKVIGDSAFKDSKLLSSVVIPASVTAIEANAFNGCAALNNVVIPASVEKLGDYAFAGCSSLSSFELAERRTDIALGTHLFDGCASLTQLVEFPNMTVFTDYMYAGTGIVDLVIPDHIVDLKAQGVFSNCVDLKTVTFPAGMKGIIGGRFFKGCSALENVVLPTGITTLGTAGKSTLYETIPSVDEVFMDCTSLKSITFSANQFYGSTFENCTSLTTVNAANVYGTCNRMFANCTSLTGDVFDKIVNASKEAFLNCTGLVGEITATSLREINSHAFSGCANITKLIIGNRDLSITEFSFTGLTEKTTVFFQNFDSMDKAVERYGNSKWAENTEAKFAFKSNDNGKVDYSLTDDERMRMEKVLGSVGASKEFVEAIEKKIVAYKAAFAEVEPADVLNKEEIIELSRFMEEFKIDPKAVDTLTKEWIMFKFSLAEQLAASPFAITEAEDEQIRMFMKEAGINTKENYNLIRNALVGYKKGFTETKPAKELTKEEREQLNLFLRQLGVAEPDKFMDTLAKQWLTLKQTLAANSAPAVSYLTEKEEQELFLLLEKAGIPQDAWDAIKAGFSDYKLNFTDTKAEKEISKEDTMNLLYFLMDCGADEKTASRFLDKAVPMWAEYRMSLAARNEKAQLTKEDTAMVDSFVKSMGLKEDAADVLYKKLFNYKRFFNETEPGKELTEEERNTLIALLEELGAKVEDKMIDKIAGQWIEYKMMLIKTMMG